MTLAFGLVVPRAGSAVTKNVDAFLAWMAENGGPRLTRRESASYETLADDAPAHVVDVAWLPPIVHVRLGASVVALGSVLRGGRAEYEAALVVPRASRLRTIDALRGARAGWVDRWSAAGFVLPRVKLALLGVDPRNLFRTEAFFGSHRAALEALFDGAIDVTGTYARAGEDGEIREGGWSEIPGAEVRIIATFGAVPPDVLAVRSELSADTRESLLQALRAAAKAERPRTLLREVFGGDELREGEASGYPALASALEMAHKRGLFD